MHNVSLNDSKIFFLFGKPGSGKTTVGRIAERKYGISFYDADNDLTPEILACIRRGSPVSDAMRGRFYRVVKARVRRIASTCPRIAVSIPTMTDDHRGYFLSAFPGSVAVCVLIRPAVHERRLHLRKSHIVSHQYWKTVKKNFAAPKIPCIRLSNNGTMRELQAAIGALFERI